MGLGNAFDLRNDLSFEDFCQILESKRFDSTFIPTFNQVEWTHSCIQLNEILRFENLAEDLDTLFISNLFITSFKSFIGTILLLDPIKRK